MSFVRGRLSCVASLFLLLAGAALHAAEPYGLTNREPIGPFLNSELPSYVMVQTGKWATIDAFTNLTVDDPTMLIPEPGSHRLYVSTRQGQIFSFTNDPGATSMLEFLNLTNVTQGWDDCGLLGFSFHPQFNRKDVFKHRFLPPIHRAMPRNPLGAAPSVALGGVGDGLERLCRPLSRKFTQVVDSS